MVLVCEVVRVEVMRLNVLLNPRVLSINLTISPVNSSDRWASGLS